MGTINYGDDIIVSTVNPYINQAHSHLKGVENGT